MHYFLQAYERRARVVRPGKEAKFWADVTADIMSEEERVEDRYVRHPPSYRSNKFIMMLDQRGGKKSSSHARFSREEGSPRKLPTPRHAKPWMIQVEPPQDQGDEADQGVKADQGVESDHTGSDSIDGDHHHSIDDDPVASASDDLFSSDAESD